MPDTALDANEASGQFCSDIGTKTALHLHENSTKAGTNDLCAYCDLHRNFVVRRGQQENPLHLSRKPNLKLNADAGNLGWGF